MQKISEELETHKTTQFKSIDNVSEQILYQRKKMANEHIQTWLTSLVIRQIQIKTTTKRWNTPAHLFRMKGETQNLTTPSGGKDRQQLEISHGCGCARMVLWKIVWWFLIKWHILLPVTPVFSFPGIYSNEMKTCVHTKSYMQVFLEALSVIAKKLETIQVSLSRGKEKQTVVHPFSEIVINKKREQHKWVSNAFR